MEVVVAQMVIDQIQLVVVKVVIPSITKHILIFVEVLQEKMALV
jgi:hypothetical protein